MWAAVAVTLGAWEALAVSTRRVPTITATARAAHARNRTVARVLFAAWALALWRHLTYGDAR